MFVFKFGGASVKSAEAVRNIVEILRRYKEDKIVVVVSAMGKTTNALERIIDFYSGKKKEELTNEVEQLKQYHLGIVNGLFEDKNHAVYRMVEGHFEDLAGRLTKDPTLNLILIMISSSATANCYQPP